MADELDTGAILSATDRLMRTLRGPLGGAASWEWSDLLAAATGRSPFEFTSLAREAGLAVPDPSNVQPADVAAQLLRVARDMEPADRARVHRVARLLDPSLPDHDLLDADTHAALEEGAPGAPSVGETPAPDPSPPPQSTQQSPPATRPLGYSAQPPTAPPKDLGPSPHPAFRTTPPSGMRFPSMQQVRPPRTVPDAKPMKRNAVGRLVGLGVLAFFMLWGLIEEGFGGG